MRNNSILHDIIEFFEIRTPRIFEIVAPLYQKGLSITEIANQTGLKRTAIWKSLKPKRDELRPRQSAPYERWRKGHKRTGARPPYGFCFLQGEIVREPKEYPTLLLIHALWTQGEGISDILRDLKGRGLKSRTGKVWNYGVIKMTIGRMKSGAIVEKDGDLFLSEDFLKVMALPPKSQRRSRKEKV